MHTLKFKKQKLDTVLCPRYIPVRHASNSRVVMHYDMSDMFSKWGNGDGDDEFLCSIAKTIIEKIQARGASLELMGGIHNGYAIEAIRHRGQVWNLSNLDIDHYDVDSDETYSKILNSLPHDVRTILIELATNGIIVDEEM